METPSSTRMMTRSQAKAALTNTTISSRKMEDSAKSKQRTQEKRTVLEDITNDSPIVGVASGSLSEATPVSSMAKQKSNRCKMTPGSGEALLRGQVKNLLQRVEEEGEISKFLSFDTGCGGGAGGGNGNHGLKGLFNTPGGLLAPTPVNTPQVFSFNSSLLDQFESLGSVLESPIEDKLTVSKVVNGIIDGMQQPESEIETDKNVISRTLFMDFSEKSDTSSDCSPVVTYQGTADVTEKGTAEKSPLKEDDDASVWSMQVNVSIQGEDEEEEEVIQEDDFEDEFYADEEGDLLGLDELCEGIKNINVYGEQEVATFMGKHVRFEYNSDDELDATEVLHFKGLPTPQGKHLRFHDQDEE